MATLHSPVELPTGRQSVVEFPMTANIQDPTSWDALANDRLGARHALKHPAQRDNSRPVPTYTTSPPSSSRGQQSIRAKASPAMDFPPQELEAQPLSYFPPRMSSAPAASSERSSKQNTQETLSDSGHATQTSDDYSESAMSASTAGTNSILDSQVYTIPTSIVAKEDSAESPTTPSIRSTSSSVKKSGVPTSKYKKKPPPSLRSSMKRKSQNGSETPLASPMSSHTQGLHSPSLMNTSPPMPSELPTILTPTTMYMSIPTPPLPPPPPDNQEGRLGQAPLQHAKSTASVRKARALHSHPSAPSLRSEDMTQSPPLPQLSPNPSSMRSRKSVESSRNRPSLYDLAGPTPAPTGPLPDLPLGVQPLSRPASRDVIQQPTPPPDVHVRPNTSGSTVAPTLRRQDTSPPIHAEMANFMTSNSKIIFRRFHDVHVRLLLTLQDEISTLEKELAEIESVDNPIDFDREARRVRVLSDLRKLLAEYDHLFSNWNLMQASKADTKTREDLEQFLKRPRRNSASTISAGAVDDLLWLQTHRGDLSCVDLNAKKDQVSATENEVLKKAKSETAQTQPVSSPSRNAGGGSSGTAGGGGFAALFASCAGKRK